MDADTLNARIDCWFGWPWNDTRNAVAFTCELIRSILPARGHDISTSTDDETDTTGGPYRSRGTRVIDAEPIEILDARCAVNTVLDCLDDYVAGRPICVPEDAVTEQDPQSRLYWYAKLIGENARRAGRQAAGLYVPLTQPRPSSNFWSGKHNAPAPSNPEEIARAHLCRRWTVVSDATLSAAEFIQKWAVSMPPSVACAPDGAASAILGRIVRGALHPYRTLDGLIAPVAQRTSCILDPDNVQKHVIDWRIRDATRGRTIPQEVIEDLHDAFEAAWMAGRWEFGYSLLDAPDLQREDG
jgi:hypothetical protein